MTGLDHVLERSVLISATRATVYQFFTDSQRFASWWGAGSRIDGRPGGAVKIQYPNGESASGSVLELVENARVVFTYGYDTPGKPIATGASRVVVTLEDQPGGTLLRLRHEFADAVTRDQHVAGWRYQLALFANAAASVQHAELALAIDRYCALWSQPDAALRGTELADLTTLDVAFKDAFGCTSGRDDLDGHIAAVQMHMPGIVLRRDGEVRQCQGTAVAGWAAVAGGNQVVARGVNVYDLAADGRIARIVGLPQL